jgi:hypothetical protein
LRIITYCDIITILQFGFSSITNAWKSITTVASKVLEATAAIVTLAVTSDLAVDEPTTVEFVNYNYDAASKSAVGELDLIEALAIDSSYADNLNVICTECYAYAALSIVLYCKIESHDLKVAKIYAEGKIVVTKAISEHFYIY